MNTNFNFSFLGLIFILLSYLLGSVPTGVWYSLANHKIDIRHLGSGNSGSTNIGRNFGLKAAVIVALIDVLKGWIPVSLASLFFKDQPEIIIFTALACVIGHAYPIFANFKGGKMVATSIGALLAINFPLALAQVICLFLILYVTSLMSFSALLSYGAATLYIIISHPLSVFKLGFFVIYLLMVYRHRANIQRLITGQEPMISWGLAYHRQLGFLDGFLRKIQEMIKKRN
ncbi:glycerol-3-phosphate 1-O-acyltransferase PlsY [Ignavigranum ruoffiae]|uniref:glycerol-3-phosphate 1-O-acyltransferase PlsY n=1 Tax=Ignavigranum ruoffiae TaxID=89093 RepID=UPI0024AE76D9|nr:glycerol-3-phosphate 1-O-acyltransferase PlsY [Ignavigranum ruoffiae]